MLIVHLGNLCVLDKEKRPAAFYTKFVDCETHRPAKTGLGTAKLLESACVPAAKNRGLLYAVEIEKSV